MPPRPRTPPCEGAAASLEGPNARERLVDEALRLFAHQGYARTSVREIADAALVNIAAIRYYFGDKAGLYRAAFFEPMNGPDGCGAPGIAWPLPPGDPLPPLPVLLQALFDGLLAPLREGERARMCMRLHFREMLEPTGLWQELIDREIRPMHEVLLQALQAHLALPEPDDDLRRLAVSLVGLGVHLHVGAEVIACVAPSVAVQGPAVAAWTAPLVDYALAMVSAEAARRTGIAPQPAGVRSSANSAHPAPAAPAPHSTAPHPAST